MTNLVSLKNRIDVLETRGKDIRGLDADRQLFEQAFLTDVSGNYTGSLSADAAAGYSPLLLGLLGFVKEPEGFFVHGKQI